MPALQLLPAELTQGPVLLAPLHQASVGNAASPRIKGCSTCPSLWGLSTEWGPRVQLDWRRGTRASESVPVVLAAERLWLRGRLLPPGLAEADAGTGNAAPGCGRARCRLTPCRSRAPGSSGVLALKPTGPPGALDSRGAIRSLSHSVACDGAMKLAGVCLEGT